MKLQTLCTLAIVGIFSSPLSAVTLLDNTSTPFSSTASFGWSVSGYSVWLIQTGSTAYDLNSIQFAYKANITPQVGQITFSLYSGQTPSGTAVASQTFSNVSFSLTRTAVTYNLQSGFSMAANSVYSLAFTTDRSDLDIAGTDYRYAWSSDDGYSFLGRKLTFDGVNFFGPYTNGTPWLKLESVPEPSAVSLLAVGLGGVIALRRCRRSAV